MSLTKRIFPHLLLMLLVTASFSANAELKSLLGEGSGNSLLDNMLNNGGGGDESELTDMFSGLGQTSSDEISDADAGSGLSLFSVVNDMVESNQNTKDN